MLRPVEATSRVASIQCLGKEERQDRYHAVLGRHRHAGVTLFHLEPAQILRRRRIGRSAEEGGEAVDVADIVALRIVAEVPRIDVVDQRRAEVLQA